MAKIETAGGGSWLDTVGGFVSSTGSIILNGIETYAGVNQRIAAVRATSEDTVTDAAAKVPEIVTGKPTSLPSWVLPAAAAVGVLLLILLLRRR